MKSIIVKNLKIQFDSFDEGADMHTAINTLEEINSVLQERFPDIQPQLFVGSITGDDIEITSEEEDEEPTKFCPNCHWEGREEDLGTTTDLSDENIGHEVGYGKCCPKCRYENIEEL
jgi:fructosamine-3-kinase